MILLVTTSHPSSVSAAGNTGGPLVLLDAGTGTVTSTLRVAVDTRHALGMHSLSCLSSSSLLGQSSSSSKLAIGYGVNPHKSDDTYGMLFTIRASNLAPLCHWKCRLPEPDMRAGLVPSPCGHYLVGGGSTGTCYLWEIMGGTSSRILRSFQAHYRAVSVLCWVNDHVLVTAGQDGLLQAYELADLVDSSNDTASASCHSIRSWSHHRVPITAVQVLPQDRVVVASEDGQVSIVEVFSELVLATFTFSQPLKSLAANDTGNRVFLGGTRGTIFVLDLDEYALYQSRHQWNATVVERSGVSGDHGIVRRVIYGADRARGGAEQYQQELRGHNRAITALHHFCDEQRGDLLCSGDAAGCIKIWSVASRMCITTVQPWSASGMTATVASKIPKQKVAAPPDRPVTSICVCDAPSANAVLAPAASFTPMAAFGRHHAGAAHSAPNVASLIPPLQRFATLEPLATIPISGMQFADMQLSNLMDVSLLENSLDLTNILRRKRSRQQMHPTVPTTSDATAVHQGDSVDDDDAGNSEADLLCFDDGTPSRLVIADEGALTSTNEEVQRRQVELREARHTIQRWEAVNNKLMAKLQNNT